MRIKYLYFDDCKTVGDLQAVLQTALVLPEEERLHIQLFGLEEVPQKLEQEVKELLRVFDRLSAHRPNTTVEIVKRRAVYLAFHIYYDDEWENEFEDIRPVRRNINGVWVDTLTLDFTHCKTWWELHTILKVTFGFPEYYGKNLDALRDLLDPYTDDRLHIRIVGLENLPAELNREVKGMLKVFDDVHRELPHMTFEVVRS